MRDITKCDFCEKPMVGYTDYQICFHCENHEKKAVERTTKILDQIEKDRRQMLEEGIEINNKNPYTTVGFGMGGYYAVKKAWYEKDQMWDNCQTGPCVKKRADAVVYAQDWAKAEEIECHA